MSSKDLEKRREQRRQYYRDNPEKWKNPDGTWKRGGTSESRAKISAEYYARNKERIQEGCRQRRIENRVSGTCPLCLRELEQLVRDHNHTTGAYRDHICAACNLMLGPAYEDPDTLRRAIQYLNKHNKDQ